MNESIQSGNQKVNSNLEAALKLARTGFAVFAIKQNSKEPATKHGFKDATTNNQEIENMFKNQPKLNVGIATGAKSGNLAVIDVDTHNNKIDAKAIIDAWTKKNGDLKPTLTALTGGGGLHFYYFTDEEQKSTNNEEISIDLKAKNGYVVAPPSKLDTGGYKWLSIEGVDRPAVAGQKELAFMDFIKNYRPSKILDTKEKEKKERSPITPLFELPIVIAKGARNDTLFRYGASLQAQGYSDNDIIEELNQANNANCEQPIEQTELNRIIKQVTNYQKGLSKANRRSLTSFKDKALLLTQKYEQMPSNEIIDTLNVKSPAQYIEKIKNRDNLPKPIKTGFSNLDKALNGGFYPANLIAVGAGSSVGKTSFCLTIAKNIASQGKRVLYVSMEETALMLTARLISMVTRSHATASNGVGYLDLVTQTFKPTKQDQKAIEQATKELEEKTLKNFYLWECKERPTIIDVRAVAKALIEQTNHTPVIFIDYLQLIQPLNERQSDKQIVDFNINNIKNLANELNTPVILISSTNRSSYNAPIEFESFKESGGIEYSCDVALGLEVEGLARISKESTNEKKEQKELKLKNATERQNESTKIEIRILKNRYGQVRYNDNLPIFEFNKKFCCFTEVEKIDSVKM